MGVVLGDLPQTELMKPDIETAIVIRIRLTRNVSSRRGFGISDTQRGVLRVQIQPFDDATAITFHSPDVLGSFHCRIIVCEVFQVILSFGP